MYIEIGEVVLLTEEAEDLELLLRKLVVGAEVSEHLQIEHMTLSLERMTLIVTKSCM